MQFLIAAGVRNKEPECPNGMAALLGKLEEGSFQNPLVGSQLLPVLHGKSYVDIASIECHAKEGTVENWQRGDRPHPATYLSPLASL